MLNGIKVLSFTHYLQGPSAVQTLADLGADVTKVEPPKGAYERHWSGFDTYMNGVSVFFMMANRNQKSLAIDLKSPEGKEIIYKLVKQADVVVENFRPGVMEKLGFGYEALAALNPRLIYCSCTGYGSSGPYLGKAGQDLLIQGLSGLASLTGKADSGPTPVGTAPVDQHGAVLAALGVLAALFDRERTGKGHKVDCNLLNAALDLQIEPLNYFLNKGPLWDKLNSGLCTRFHQAPYGVYRTADGWITLSLAPVDKLREAFGSDSLDGYTAEDQMMRRDEVDRIVADEMKKRTTADWYEIFDRLDIWHTPANEYADVVRDPQVAWNEMIVSMNVPVAGEVKTLSHPNRYDGKAPPIRMSPPRLGEHTAAILRDAGVDDDSIAALVEKGVVRVAQ
ncbi:CaiB/BaiF CoA transferase family protein [Uliginosibacterium sp. sgz301328]|uniref:CaiB/BaiF CoA transferase family protein n=1 Tax=Uliginosibacterium sp. sgz301328 TaxID=3243764 RepID=UPI00359DB907